MKQCIDNIISRLEEAYKPKTELRMCRLPIYSNDDESVSYDTVKEEADASINECRPVKRLERIAVRTTVENESLYIPLFQVAQGFVENVLNLSTIMPDEARNSDGMYHVALEIPIGIIAVSFAIVRETND
jgi:hypothetical protein